MRYVICAAVIHIRILAEFPTYTQLADANLKRRYFYYRHIKYKWQQRSEYIRKELPYNSEPLLSLNDKILAIVLHFYMKLFLFF